METLCGYALHDVSGARGYLQGLARITNTQQTGAIYGNQEKEEENKDNQKKDKAGNDR
jgi:hypothetical protein